jgi:peptidoglycan hydrolase CwlO-like protein
MMADKKEILESLEKQLRSLESEIAKLKALASKVEKSSTLIISEVENLENEENILKMELGELKKSGDAWKELELGVDKQLENLTFNVSAALNKFKDRVK